MKPTKIKISVSQDGLLPQKTLDLATLEFPVFQKRLLKALGFERVDSNTFVGVLPVFFHLSDKRQAIELELGVSLPEVRKKLLEILQAPISRIEEPEQAEEKGRRTTRRTRAKAAPAKDEKKAKVAKTKRAAKTTTVKKTAARKTKGKVDARK